MQTLLLVLGLSAFLVGSRIASPEKAGALRIRISNWFAETHSAGFELRRHFFRRFFDTDLIADPSQAKVFAGGVLAIVISVSFVYAQAYYHKYLQFENLDDFSPYRRASLADFLFMITLAMNVVALFTTLQWPSLFPGLRDYLALAGLPVRMRDIFVAKFTALLAFASMAVLGVTALPSVLFPAVMAGRYDPHLVRQVPGIFVSGSLAGFFIFFSLVTVQGVLLNVLPVRQFQRVSLAAQGLLLAVLLCALPLVFSIPNLSPYMEARPAWSVFAPPLWFLGVDQVIAGHWEPLAQRLSNIAYASVALSAACAVLTYLWSYRRHRTRVIESPGGVEARTAPREWAAHLTDRLLPNSRALAVFGFIAKSLARSRQHRLILTAFGAIALAVISEGFAGLLLQGGVLRHISVSAPAFRQAVIAVPLALSLFTLTGLRYLFRLPVELRANWIFRVHEPGNAPALLAGAENFLIYCGILPVALLTLPAELALLGIGSGFLAALACLFASLALMELLLFSLERIPFTSSYFPGKDPPVVTVLKYALGSSLYVGALSSVIRLALLSPASMLLLLFLLAAAWLRARTARLNVRQIARLTFEELADPTVLLLRIERD
jgi:hypothetical protein